MSSGVYIEKTEKKFKTIVTARGKEKAAAALLEGTKVNIIHAAAGDGNGAYYMPTEDMTALVNERWRGEIAAKEINPKAKNMIDVKFVIPGTVGGFTVRECGLFDEDGEMIAVCNVPEAEKAVLDDGAMGALTVVMHLVTADGDALTFEVDQTIDTVSEINGIAPDIDGRIVLHAGDIPIPDDNGSGDMFVLGVENGKLYIQTKEE